MNTLLIILIVIIILALIYLFYRNKEYQKILESFDNSRNSLSTYMQNTVDYDSFMNTQNSYTKNLIPINLKKVGWDGIWENESLHIYCQLLQNNDKLIISLSNSSFTLSNYSSFNYAKIMNTFNVVGDNTTTPTDSNNIDIYYINDNTCEITVTNNDSNSGWSSPINIKIFNIEKTNSTIVTIPISATNMYTSTFNIFEITLYPVYDTCPKNSFVGIGQLNENRLIFNLVEVLCSNYKDSNLNLNINQFSGELNNNIVTFYSIDKSTHIQLTKSKNFESAKDARYINKVSPYTNALNIIPDSEIEIETNLCNTGSPCTDISNGLTQTMYSGQNYNACGTPVSETDNTCASKPNCVFYSPAPDGMNTCAQQSVKLYDYMNFMPSEGLLKHGGNTLDICEYLKMFSPEFCNSCILCYITDVGDVKTLNYQYFGALSNESSLTTQYDYMYQYLNSTSSQTILPFYRNIINNNDVLNGPNALSFTNCLRNNKIAGTYNTQVSTALKEAQKYVSKYSTKTVNSKLLPALWQINNNSTYNMSTSCEFTLSTSVNYNTPVKYVQIDKDGTTNLSLYQGGTNQKFIFDDARIINKNEIGNDPFIAMTANIRTNNELYLIPESSTNGFSSMSNIVNLKSAPEVNGKWFILGFKLNNLTTENSIKSALNTINLSV